MIWSNLPLPATCDWGKSHLPVSCSPHLILYNFRLPDKMLMSKIWIWNLIFMLYSSSKKAKVTSSPCRPKVCKASLGGTSSLCKHAADATAQPSSSECRITRRREPFSPVIPCNLDKYNLGSKYSLFPEKLWLQLHQRHNCVFLSAFSRV